MPETLRRNAMWGMKMRPAALLLVAIALAATASSARAASFSELVSWCAPQDQGGRPTLCFAYLETYLEALGSTDPDLNDGVRACVPASADRTALVKQVLAYAKDHPAEPNLSGIGGVGMALKGSYPCS
jgi:hypothetical protein